MAIAITFTGERTTRGNAGLETGFEEARCPNPKCKKLIATVSGDWTSVKVRCHRCGVVVEAKRG